MKKLMFTLALVSVAFTSAQAQKQLGGEHNVEVAFAPFGGNPINSSTLKYRNFLDDDRALRVTLGLNNTKNKYLVVPSNTLGEPGQADGTHEDLFLENIHFSYELGLGYEMHFKGTDNLSPYFAFGASYGQSSFTLQRDHWSAVAVLDANQPFWEANGDPSSWDVWSYSNTIESSTINIDLLFGADYYFNDAIYVGFEAGFRFSNSSGITSTITASNNDAFNMYFDGGSNNLALPQHNPTQASINGEGFVQNIGTNDGYIWDTSGEVNYVINGQPWNSLEDEGVVTAVDQLWSDWNEQSPENLDDIGDDVRDAYYNGTNFLGTYSTGQLRIGFLFE